MNRLNSVDESGARRPVLVWCSGASWDGVAGTDRHMATALTRYADVLWVDPAVSPVTSLRSGAAGSVQIWPALTRIDAHLVRLTPCAIPFHTRRALRRVTSRLNRLQLRWALRRLRLRPHAVVVSHLDDLLGRWGKGTRSILYGTDDYVAGAELMRIDVKRIQEEERIQLRNADLAVVISPQLAERWKALGFDRPITVIANGVDTTAYRALEAVSPAPDVELPFPVAGVVGQLSARIDIQLLEEVVDAGCSLLMVGPRDRSWESERFARLLARPAVVWVDRVPFAELPPYLKRIDVGLTPYLDTPFNRASFPLKTLEYLAAGKPVVSTDLPSARSLQTDLVILSERCQFGRAARNAALTTSSSELVARRMAFAEQHSWPRRAAEFAVAIGLT